MAESALAPPGPIPNPVVTRRSAGEYCGGDPAGGEAAAGTPDPREHAPEGQGTRPTNQDGTRPSAAGWSSGSSLGS